MKLGAVINALRTAEGISQTDLAVRLGVSRVYLSQVENGHRDPALPFIKQVSKELGIPVPLLLIDDEDEDADVTATLKSILADVIAARFGKPPVRQAKASTKTRRSELAKH